MKMMKILVWTLTALLVSSCSQEVATQYGFFTDSFDGNQAAWKEITLEGKAKGSRTYQEGTLKLTGVGQGYYGTYYNQIISGHFIVDLEFEKDENIGLALIQSKNGRPDPNNYTLLSVDQVEGKVVVTVRDRQNGQQNVLDYTGETDFDREPREEEGIELGNDLYQHVLTGNQYSVPFTGTNGKIRIFREANGGMFHYYYEVKKTYQGQDYVDWMEVRPSPDWTGPGSEFFVAIVTLHEGEAVIQNIHTADKPVADQDDRETGFKVTQREYNWSGFMGDAYVVTFDSAFQYQARDIKFVFWTEMNYIPHWHLNDQLLYTYEFVETWGGGVAGCNEPMSDRVRQWTWVKVLEDNPVRKVLQWHYVLANPDYEVPMNGQGDQLPEVDEIWTFYPDGTGTRKIRYTPKLDTDFRAPHELGEMISIAGSKSHSSEFYDEPALSIMNLEGERKQAHPGPKFDYYSEIDDWKQQLIAVHFKEEPDVFAAWSVDPDIPETYSGYKIRYENAWQNPNGKIVHWPVNKRPYTSAFAAGGTWKSEVSHACLLSYGVRDGEDWEDHYQVDERGRKYREWVSLVGVNEKGNEEIKKRITRSWLYQGRVITEDKGLSFKGKNRMDNTFVFEVYASGPDAYSFAVPNDPTLAMINPAIRLKNWPSGVDLEVRLNDQEVSPDAYRKTQRGDDLLLWINTTLNPGTRVTFWKSSSSS